MVSVHVYKLPDLFDTLVTVFDPPLSFVLY